MHEDAHHTLFVAVETWKQNKGLTARDWLSKLGSICSREHSAAVKTHTDMLSQCGRMFLRSEKGGLQSCMHTMVVTV